MSRRVDQLVAGFAEGDAISQEARCIRDQFRALGVESEIYAPDDRIATGAADACRSLADYKPAAADDVVLFHYSVASPVTDVFLRSGARRVVRYHNITPAHFFRGVDDSVAAQLDEAREGLKAVAAAAERTWADSSFNADEIRELGIANVDVVPLFFRFTEWDTPADPVMLQRLGGGLKNFLFVGRMAPNKCVEELIEAFAWYHGTIDPASRLVLVGSERSCPRYFAMLKLFAGRLGLANVCFEGFLTQAQLTACYQSATAFVCTSRHEGFCLPLVEAMYHGVPVVARNCGGMPEASGEAGILFDDLEPRVLAELLHEAAVNDSLRTDVLAAQQRHVDAARNRDMVAPCRELLGLG